MSARFPGSAGYNQTDATGVLFPSGGAMAAKRFSTGAAVTVQPWAAFLFWVRPFVFRRWWLIWGLGLSTLSSRRRDRKFCVRLRSVILALCNGLRILRKHGSEGGCTLMDPQGYGGEVGVRYGEEVGVRYCGEVGVRYGEEVGMR